MARVLLVDDEPALLFTLSQLLKSRGLEPVLARSAPEALDKLDGVDGVVTDYSMPGMDGVQLVQAIHERDESLPVVMLTAHGSERIAVRAMKGVGMLESDVDLKKMVDSSFLPADLQK